MPLDSFNLFRKTSDMVEVYWAAGDRKDDNGVFVYEALTKTTQPEDWEVYFVEFVSAGCILGWDLGRPLGRVSHVYPLQALHTSYCMYYSACCGIGYTILSICYSMYVSICSSICYTFLVSSGDGVP